MKCALYADHPQHWVTLADPSRHGHKSSVGVLWCLAWGCWQWILWVPWVAGWGLSLEQTCPTDTSTGWDLVNLGIQSTPFSFSAVECCCYEGVYLVYNSVWVGGACQVAPPWIPGPIVSQQNTALHWMTDVIHFTISGSNVVVDQCRSSSVKKSCAWGNCSYKYNLAKCEQKQSNRVSLRKLFFHFHFLL